MITFSFHLWATRFYYPRNSSCVGLPMATRLGRHLVHAQQLTWMKPGISLSTGARGFHPCELLGLLFFPTSFMGGSPRKPKRKNDKKYHDIAGVLLISLQHEGGPSLSALRSGVRWWGTPLGARRSCWRSAPGRLADGQRPE